MRPRSILARVVSNLGPPPCPVRFRSDIPPCSGLWGQTILRRDHFVIRLRRDVVDLAHRGDTYARPTLQDTVIHELAHVYAWHDGAAYHGDHDEVWGVMYSRIYCAVTGGH